MESNRLKLLIDMHHPQNSTETEHYRSSQHIGLSYKTLQTCASWKAQSQVDSDWLSLFLLFITWRKSESDSKYHCIPPCHCSCAVDFPFLIALQRLYTYRYSYPWCEWPFTLESGKISLTYEHREMQSRKPEAELERSDYRTLSEKCKYLSLQSTHRHSALLFFFPLSVFSYLLYSSGAHGSGLLWLHILYLPGRPAGSGLATSLDWAFTWALFARQHS